MRRDLEIDCDPADLVLLPPDRSQLREMFRRFEFRNLLNRIDELDAALPAAAPIAGLGTEVPWREGDVPALDGEAGIALGDGRVAVAKEEVVVGRWSPDVASRLRDARGRGRHQDVRRLDRSRRVPALLRERVPDDDSARRRRRQRLHT